MTRAGVCLASASVAVLAAAPASADVPFVDRPLTLPPLRLSADVGVGFGDTDLVELDTTTQTPFLRDEGVKVGWGLNLEAAAGFPYVGEFAARFGYRFDMVAAVAEADRFGRPFDPVLDDPGTLHLANPEIDWRRTMFAVPRVEFALEARAMIPTTSDSFFELVVGVPVRIHLPTLARIDTGVYLPVAFDSPTTFGIQVPVQLFFQVGDSFFGPLIALVLAQNVSEAADGTVTAGPLDQGQVTFGVGGGHTFDGILDLKAQVYSTQISDPQIWAKNIGGGLGLGLRL
ncbi:MAG: hypothetical protein ACLP1X_09205 [Polyangiaceae bacterium]